MEPAIAPEPRILLHQWTKASGERRAVSFWAKQRRKVSGRRLEEIQGVEALGQRVGGLGALGEERLAIDATPGTQGLVTDLQGGGHRRRIRPGDGRRAVVAINLIHRASTPRVGAWPMRG